LWLLCSTVLHMVFFEWALTFYNKGYKNKFFFWCAKVFLMANSKKILHLVSNCFWYIFPHVFSFLFSFYRQKFLQALIFKPLGITFFVLKWAFYFLFCFEGGWSSSHFFIYSSYTRCTSFTTWNYFEHVVDWVFLDFLVLI